MNPPETDWRPDPRLIKVAAYAACGIVIGVAAVLLVTLLGRLSLVLFPVVLTLFLVRALTPPYKAMVRRGLPPAAGAALTLFGFLGLVAGLVYVVAPPVVAEAGDLGATLEDGLSEVENWLIESGSFDIDREDIDNFKEEVGERARSVAEGSTETVARGARLLIEVVVGVVLALILTFFGLKDGDRFVVWVTSKVPEDRRRDASLAGGASWAAIGGYLRGAAILGLVEGIIIGGTMALVGAKLVIPVALLTVAAAFIPLVGATVAGVVAVLVTLATAGFGPALTVAIVAVLVQQFDNDLLAPVIYGKALSMHPVTILLVITTGTALFGFPGTVLAVPAVGAILNAVAAVRSEHGGDPPLGLVGPEPDDPPA